jgi:enoyl-CoA hydratase/carnithine racemase
MEGRFNHEFETEYLKSTKLGSLIVLEPKADGFDTLVDVHIGPKTFEWFEAIGNDKSIRGILIISEGEFFGEQSFARHLSKLTGEQISTGNPVIVKKIIDKDRRSIQINMLNTYIRTILSLPQIVFIALTNTVVSPFWGASLACDFRIAHPNLVVHLNSREFGLHPSGGVPFFMTRQVGIAKAKELLFSERFLYAEGAKNLGMINFITSHDNYKSDAIGKAVEILETTTYDYFYYTKKLMNANIIKEFENYINLEGQMEMH